MAVAKERRVGGRVERRRRRGGSAVLAAEEDLMARDERSQR